MARSMLAPVHVLAVLVLMGTGGTDVTRMSAVADCSEIPEGLPVLWREGPSGSPTAVTDSEALAMESAARSSGGDLPWTYNLDPELATRVQALLGIMGLSPGDAGSFVSSGYRPAQYQGHFYELSRAFHGVMTGKYRKLVVLGTATKGNGHTYVDLRLSSDASDPPQELIDEICRIAAELQVHELNVNPKSNSTLNVSSPRASSHPDGTAVDLTKSLIKRYSSSQLDDIALEARLWRPFKDKDAVHFEKCQVLQSLSFGTGRGKVIAKPTSGRRIKRPVAGVEVDDNHAAWVCGEGTSVTLTAAALPGSVFAGWGGDCSGTDSVCQVNMDSDKVVIAQFEEAGAIDVTGVWSGQYSLHASNVCDFDLSGTMTLELSQALGLVLGSGSLSGFETKDANNGCQVIEVYTQPVDVLGTLKKASLTGVAGQAFKATVTGNQMAGHWTEGWTGTFTLVRQ